MNQPQTYREAIASKGRPVRGYPGFDTVEYTPTVGLYSRPTRISILRYNGVVVDTGSRSDQRAVLGHQPTRERFIEYATREAGRDTLRRGHGGSR
jgi:hypothetical protein